MYILQISTRDLVVSIGRLTAFYVVFVPVEYIPSEPPPYTYLIVSFCTLQKGSNFLGWDFMVS